MYRSGRSLFSLRLQLAFAGQGYGYVFEFRSPMQTPKKVVLWSSFDACGRCKHSSKYHIIIRSSHDILLGGLGSVLVLLDADLDLVQALSHLQH